LDSGALYKSTYNIGYSDVDFTKSLKYSTLFGYFQDTASEAVEKLGAGVDTLAERYGVAWVLARIRVEFDRIPVWSESITVETWPHPPGKLEFDRDFRVRDADGDIIIKAASNWVLLDINTRELRKSDFIEMDHPPFTGEHALDRRPGRLKPSGQLEAVYRKHIGYSDVDFYGHINNSRYIDYIMDCFPVESHRKHILKSIEVNYIKEAFPGDTLVMYRDIPEAGSDTAYIEGVNEADGRPSFKARIELVPRR
jgi:medium-chain acyl-[acyl-carrier-protein] hydrolase